MPDKLFYMPLEGYKERYTHQWSAPRTGWLERRWRDLGINYVRVEGRYAGPGEIKLGCVVDGIGRSRYCFSQIDMLLSMVTNRMVTNESVIYFDDFWHPGIEALPYAFHLLGIKPKIYCFLHAQSVDCFDFTAPMEQWIRPFEKAIFNMVDGVFVCCPMLRELVYDGLQNPFIRMPSKQGGKIHVTGHPFASDEVFERMPPWYQNAINHPKLDPLQPRKNQVVWSSRWDEEKNPGFFLNVCLKVWELAPDTKFIICTSAVKLRSNNPHMLEEARAFEHTHRGRFEIREGLSKEEYYAILCESKVQFNCARQDWVAITLLEAIVAGCFPIYGHYRSFPETFLHSATYTFAYMDDFLTLNQEVEGAAAKIVEILGRDDLWTLDAIEGRSWIADRFSQAATVQLKIMGFDVPNVDYDPYNVDWVMSHFPKSVI